MFQHPDKYNRSSERGFTLVEALVSLALLTTALVPTFILATDAVKLSTSIRGSLIAANLAQEGVELVRAMRDGNWFAGQPFDTGLTGCAQGCRAAWDDTSLAPDNGTTPLRLDPVSGLYQYTTGVDSPFTRVITISAGQSASELVVKSQISWVDRSIPKTVVAEEHLFDWVK